MRYFLVLFLLVCHSACSQDSIQLANGNTKLLVNQDSISKEYAKYLSEQKELKRGYADKTDSLALHFYSIMSQGIPSFWEGTVWDFNGTSRIPRKGKIACGYFVTNVLTDLGFAIERVKLAQQASSVMIEQLCVGILKTTQFAKLEAYLAKQAPYSVFIIGLDNHTGFILKHKEKSYFLHSNYIHKQGVVLEEISKSDALLISKFYMIGSLSANQELMKTWGKAQ